MLLPSLLLDLILNERRQNGASRWRHLRPRALRVNLLIDLRRLLNVAQGAEGVGSALCVQLAR